MNVLQTLGRTLVISPHLDDAVFACGTLIASCPGTHVLTVFAGDPPPGQPLTDWDRDCGFTPTDAVMQRRREEDAAALSLLRAIPTWLEMLDAQYGPTPPIAAITRALQREIERIAPESVFFPLGLFHSDHEAVHEAVLRCATRGRYATYAYEDALYRRLDERLSERLFGLRRAGWNVTRHRWPITPGAADLKEMAVHCYRSQLRGLATSGRPGHADLAQPEGYWRLHLAVRKETDGSRVPRRVDV